MARNQSLLNLITRAYNLAGIPVPTRETVGYVTPPEMRRFINEGLALWYRSIVRASPDWVESSTTVSVVSGTASYSMPADFWMPRSVSVLYNGRDIPMPRYMSSERYQFQVSSQIPDWRYRVVDSGIRVGGAVQFQIRPEPNQSATVTVFYIPNPPLLATDGSDDAIELDGVAGWDEAICTHAAIKVKIKQEEDVTDLKDDLASLLAEVSLDATDRDEGEPKRVRDVELEVMDSDFYGRYSR